MTEWDSKKHSDFRTIILQNLIGTAFLSVLGPMATELTTVFNVGLADIGLINALFIIISGCMSFVWALFADQTERKRLLMICSIIWASCSFLIIFNVS